jgi:hypothetical protein
MSHAQVFIGYGYNDRDSWVERYVVPLVTAFGCTVVHGRAVFGGALPSEITQQIHSSHAMIGFTTRRDLAGHDAGGEKFTTHDWVVQELITALTHTPPIPFVEVREEGVVPPGGMIDAANFQRIDYREADRAGCLVKIAQALERFRVVSVRLGPDTLIDQIEPHLEDPSFVCSYQIFRGAAELQPQRVPVLSMQGSLCVDLRGISRNDSVRIIVSAGGRVWRSRYESVDTVDITLRG